MNRLLRLPRWVSVPAALGVGAMLTAACYPGGLTAAWRDCRDADQLTDNLEHARETERRLTTASTHIQERVRYKEELVAALVRGETTLTAVTDEFLELNRSDEAMLARHREEYGGRDDTEVTARNVLVFVATREPEAGDGTSAVRGRLAEEYQERFGHPPPGW